MYTRILNSIFFFYPDIPSAGATTPPSTYHRTTVRYRKYLHAAAIKDMTRTQASDHQREKGRTEIEGKRECDCRSLSRQFGKLIGKIEEVRQAGLLIVQLCLYRLNLLECVLTSTGATKQLSQQLKFQKKSVRVCKRHLILFCCTFRITSLK